MAAALVSKTSGKPCGFESRPEYHFLICPNDGTGIRGSFRSYILGVQIPLRAPLKANAYL